MATALTMVADIVTYLNALRNRLARSSGKADDVLYVDNPSGLFSFLAGAVVNLTQVATTANEVTQAKAALKANPVLYGTLLVNQSTTTLDTLNIVTGVWTAVAIGYSDYVKPERLYYSSWSNRLWITTTYGKLDRVLTTGLTEVG